MSDDAERSSVVLDPERNGSRTKDPTPSAIAASDEDRDLEPQPEFSPEDEQAVLDAMKTDAARVLPDPVHRDSAIFRRDCAVGLFSSKTTLRFRRDTWRWSLRIYHPVFDDGDRDLYRLVARSERISHKANAYVCGDDLRVIHEELFSCAACVAALWSTRISARATHQAQPSDTATVNVVRSELATIDKKYKESAHRDAQLRYFLGMILAVGVILLAATGLRGLEVPGEPALLRAAFVAGALGAVVSVLMRMTSGSLQLRYQVGPMYTRLLGVFRPALGAIFGVLMYFLLFGGGALSLQPPKEYTKQFFFTAILAFIAGFSERFAPDMLSITESSARERARIKPPGKGAGGATH